MIDKIAEKLTQLDKLGVYFPTIRMHYDYSGDLLYSNEQAEYASFEHLEEACEKLDKWIEEVSPKEVYSEELALEKLEKLERLLKKGYLRITKYSDCSGYISTSSEYGSTSGTSFNDNDELLAVLNSKIKENCSKEKCECLLK